MNNLSSVIAQQCLAHSGCQTLYDKSDALLIESPPANIALIWLLMCQILDDPTGNSFVENPFAPVKDAALDVQHYVRTRQQDVDIGCAVRPLIT